MSFRASGASHVVPSERSESRNLRPSPRRIGYPERRSRRTGTETPSARAGLFAGRRYAYELGAVGALLMAADDAFIAGSDLLIDGGVTATYWYGDLAPRA